MNDPEIEAIDEPPPEYMDLANAIVAMREWFSLCGAQRGGYPILVSEDGFGIQEMEERIRPRSRRAKSEAFTRRDQNMSNSLDRFGKTTRPGKPSEGERSYEL